MNAVNRIAHLFPAGLSVLFRDFYAHVDGFVLIEKSADAADETAARVEVFEAAAAEERCLEERHLEERHFEDNADELFERHVAANMIPIRGGQRFRVWNDRKSPVTLCFLPTDQTHPIMSLNLFSQQER
ncbi:MAG: hypothetical protein K8U03_04455 [Planctomycetia bacterium]|nr:hypothetical protein [Planctomycetia bacterium]